MAKGILSRLPNAALLALVTALWCWVMTGLHGIWSFGILLGYLDGGVLPLSPTLSVTYTTFFMYSILAPLAVFLLGCLACCFIARQYHLVALMLVWSIGAYLGASTLSFEFQLDFGTTWAPTEAIRALFVHPVITPVWIALGLAGTASLTRPFRI